MYSAVHAPVTVSHLYGWIGGVGEACLGEGNVLWDVHFGHVIVIIVTPPTGGILFTLTPVWVLEHTTSLTLYGLGNEYLNTRTMYTNHQLAIHLAAQRVIHVYPCNLWSINALIILLLNLYACFHKNSDNPHMHKTSTQLTLSLRDSISFFSLILSLSSSSISTSRSRRRRANALPR